MHTVGSDVLKHRKKRDCTVYVWGCNETSQLGLGRVTDHQYEPVPLEFFKSKKVVYVSSGCHHNTVLTASGAVYTWGKGNAGQLGAGPEIKRGFIPQRVSLRKKAQMISSGESFTAAIVDDKSGRIFTWGQGIDTGQDPNSSFFPQCMPFFAKKKVISLAAGVSHCACVVQNPGGDTEVYTWGKGEKGKLGNNSERAEKTPFLVETLRGARALTVGCGSDYTVVLSARGDVYAWGCGDSGRTGTGGIENVLVPVSLPAFNQIEIIEVSAGPDHVAAVSATGKLFTWGYGSNGRLGHGDEADVPIPTEVATLSDEKIIHVSCGGHHTAAVTDNGLLYTWGWNHYGQLGHGSVSLNDCTPTPLMVEALKSNIVLQVSCGEQHTIALVQ